MLEILHGLFVVLLVKVFGTREQQQQLADALRRNNQELEEIHQDYLAMNAHMATVTKCALRQSEQAFDGLFPGFKEELKRQKASRGIA